PLLRRLRMTMVRSTRVWVLILARWPVLPPHPRWRRRRCSRLVATGHLGATTCPRPVTALPTPRVTAVPPRRRRIRVTRRTTTPSTARRRRTTAHPALLPEPSPHRSRRCPAPRR